MMTFEQWLLGKLAEECNEVAQRALKAQQFGLDEIQQGQEKDNAERMQDEFNDLLGVVLLAYNTHAFCLVEDNHRTARKKDRLLKYLERSRTEGQVETQEQTDARRKITERENS